MKFQLDWISVLNLLGSINGIFLSTIILGFKKGNRATKNILAGLVFALSLSIFASFLWTSRFYVVFPHVPVPTIHALLSLGPLLFLYVTALTTPDFIFKRRYFVHFIPLGLYTIYDIPEYFTGAEARIHAFSKEMAVQTLETHVLKAICFTLIFIYLLLTLKRLKIHEINMKNTYSSIEKLRLNWLRYLVFAYGSVLGFYLLFYLFRVLGGDPYSAVGKLFCIWEILLVFFTGYKGLIQPEIFTQDTPDTHTEQEKTGEKYSYSPLTNRQAAEYLETLLDFMEKKKPYTESELTIGALAEQIPIPRRYLSQVINEKLKQNYYDFINRYRVEEAKRRLIQPEKRNASILEIAFDVGFNSKATFNAVFKKYTHRTPSQFRRQNP